MRYIHFFAVILFTQLLLCQHQVKAQDTLTDSQLYGDVIELIPIEIKGIRINDHSPFSVSNINEEVIEKYHGVQDFSYLLDQMPSVHVTSDAGTGVGYTSMRIRGTDDSRINFTINGIPVNNAESQQTYFVNIPDLLGSTNSIQIQRGVGSSTNGSAAFGASVNMSNLHQEDKASAQFQTVAGSYKTFKNSLRAGTGKLKGGFQFDLRLSKISSDGYIERSSSDLKSLQFLAGWTSKDNNTSLKFNLLTGKEKTGQAWNGVAQDSLTTNRRYNSLGIISDGKFYDNQTDNYQQDYYQLFANHRLSSTWDLQAALFLTRGRGYYDEYRAGEKFSTYNRPPYISPSLQDTLHTTDLTRQLWLDNYYYGATYSVHYKKNRTSWSLGGNLSRYDGKHYGFVTWADYGFENKDKWYHLTAFKNDFSIYTKWQQRIGNRLHLFGDLQYKYVRYQMSGFRRNPHLAPDEKYNFINPKAGLSYNFSHKNQSRSKLFASFATAQKEPNRDDFEASKHELPKHENLYDLELGYEYKSHVWNLSLNAYYMHYKNQLVLTGKINDVGESTRENVDKSFRTGIEWAASYQAHKKLNLQAHATFSKNIIKDFYEYIDDYDLGTQHVNHYKTTPIAFSPDWIASASALYEPFKGNWDGHNLSLAWTSKFLSRQYLDNTGQKSRSISPYSFTNLNLRYNIQTKVIKDIGLHVSLNNIFNKKYESSGYTFSYYWDQQLTTENYYFPQAGFNFLVGLQLKF